MDILVIDLTHGGVKIAISYAKKGNTVYAFDIYNTLNDIDKKMLDAYKVKIIELNHLKNLNGELKVVYPIHLPLTLEEIKKENPNLEYKFITHHEAIKELLDKWGKDILKIEVTGVKGKTSSVFMLKEILIDDNPLILSSLGALLYNNKKEIVLQKNISITPANIKESIDLAYRIANPICGGQKKDRLYNCAIFESSLGVTGIGDVGLLTNIVENYPIAKNRLTASYAKKQIFNCNTVNCQKECFDEYYSDINHDKINLFSIDDETANLYTTNIDYSFDKSMIDIEYNDVKTIDGKTISGKIQLETFALGPHHISNVLGVVLTCLTSNISKNQIKKGLKNYNGIPGRTNKRNIDGITVIEEINPGINTKAIEESINMISKFDDYYIAIGGDYGITCEEIDEDKVAKLINKLNHEIILTGEVGKNISAKVNVDVNYIPNYEEVYDLAIKNQKNLLFIYRSDYRKITKR